MAYRWKVPEFNAGFVDPDGVRNTMMRKAYIDRAANEMNGYATSWPEDIRQIPIQSQSASNSMLGYQPNGAGGFVNDRSNDAMWDDYRNQVGQERREMAEAEMNRQNTLNKITELQSELAQIDAQIAEIEKTMPKGVSDAEWEIAAKRAEIGDNSAYDNLVSRGYNQMATARSVEDNIKNELYNAEKLTWGLNSKTDEEQEMAKNQIEVSLRKAEDMASRTGTKLPEGYYRLKTVLDAYDKKADQNVREFINEFKLLQAQGKLTSAKREEAKNLAGKSFNSSYADELRQLYADSKGKTVEDDNDRKVAKQNATDIYNKVKNLSSVDAKKELDKLTSKQLKNLMKYYKVTFKEDKAFISSK